MPTHYSWSRIGQKISAICRWSVSATACVGLLTIAGCQNETHVETQSVEQSVEQVFEPTKEASGTPAGNMSRPAPASSATPSSATFSSATLPSATISSAISRTDLGSSLEEFTGPIPSRFAGSQACKSCHPDRWESYRQTSHSRSLRAVPAKVAKAEGVSAKGASADGLENSSSGQDDPPVVRTGDGVIAHQASKRTYDVHVADGHVHHREWLHFIPDGQAPTAGDVRMKLADLPVQWIMGSGTFAEAYLLRDDSGFLLQSPITHYSAVDDFDMAPGYDDDVHNGLTRVIDQQCMFCHAGLIAEVDPDKIGATNFPRVAELAIGCERCHGPGAEHSALYLANAPESNRAAIVDSKIIHPNKLDRVALDGICAVSLARHLGRIGTGENRLGLSSRRRLCGHSRVL